MKIAGPGAGSRRRGETDFVFPLRSGGSWRDPVLGRGGCGGLGEAPPTRGSRVGDASGDRGSPGSWRTFCPPRLGWLAAAAGENRRVAPKGGLRRTGPWRARHCGAVATPCPPGGACTAPRRAPHPPELAAPAPRSRPARVSSGNGWARVTRRASSPVFLREPPAPGHQPRPIAERGAASALRGLQGGAAGRVHPRCPRPQVGSCGLGTGVRWQPGGGG